MAKPKKKLLPKNFEEILKVGTIDDIKAIFGECDINARGGAFKQSALAFAECPEELTRWLVEQGADLSAPDTYGETPLHSLAGHWQGRVELLLELGADVHHDGGGRGTPLHQAAKVGNLRAAQALLAHGASVDAKNADGQTPLVAALQQCSNIMIERLAPMAELLLNAMAKPVKKPNSFFARIMGGATPPSTVTPEMKARVTQIGVEFEFHRTGFNPEAVDAVSHALSRLYVLFDVPPVPRRALHDGKALIVAKPGRWEEQHQQLWAWLVPSSGAAPTVQGEVIRIAGRLTDELERNGGQNWDKDFRRMADAFLRYIASGEPLPALDLEAAKRIASDVKSLRGDAWPLGKLAVDWVALNPNPIPTPSPDYRR
jgi:hypothetical protein